MKHLCHFLGYRYDSYISPRTQGYVYIQMEYIARRGIIWQYNHGRHWD